MADANVDSTQQAQDAQTLDNLTSLQQTDAGTTAPTGGTSDATVTNSNPAAPDTPSLYNDAVGTNNNQPNLEAAGTNSLLDTTTFTNDGRDGTANDSPTIGSSVVFGTDVNTGDSQVQYTVTNENPTIQASGANGTQNTVGGTQGGVVVDGAATTEATTATTETAAAPTDAPITNTTPAPILNPDGTPTTDPIVDPLIIDDAPQEPLIRPTVSISATDAVAVEDTTNNTVVFTVTQTNASTQATSIVVTLDRNTVEAADITSVSYIAADGVTVVPVALATLEAGLSLTIPATDGTPWSPVFTFTVNPDTIYEVSESLIMNLALADGETDAILGVPTASATIYDQDSINPSTDTGAPGGTLPTNALGDKPTVSISATDAVAVEDTTNNTVVFTVTQTNASTQATSIVVTLDRNTVEAADITSVSYIAADGVTVVPVALATLEAGLSLTIPATDGTPWSPVFTFTVNPDTIYEVSESLIMNLALADGETDAILGVPTASATIYDQDSINPSTDTGAPGGTLPTNALGDKPTVSISATDAVAVEDTTNNTVVFTVTQTNASTQATSIVVTLDRNTVEAADITSVSYIAADGVTVVPVALATLEAGLSLTIPATDGTPWSPVFTFTVNPDTIYEVSESLIMNLALADGETDAILGVPTASATIYDQDSINPSTDTGAPGGTLPTNALGDKPTVSISATDAVAVEDTTNNTVVFTVTQTNASTQATSIVVTLDRNTVEAADITSVSYIAADGVTVVPVALATLEAGLSLTIPATDGTPWSPVFTFTVNPDTIYEVSESLIMNLALADGETDAILGVPTASATIYDQDSINPSTDTGAPGGTLPTNALGDKPTVSISATDAVAVEDTTNNTVVFTVTQTNASTQATSIVVTLDRNTVEAADITSVSYIAADGVTVVPVALATLEAGLSLTIPATDGTPWSPVFTFTVNPDTIYEVSESLIMNLALADGETDAILGVPTASATIYDQDSINPSTDTGAPGGTLPTNALGDKPTVSISATDAVAVEDTTNNTVVFTVTQTNASTQATSIVVTLDRNTVEAADITSVSYIAADGVTVVPVALATLEAGLSLTIPATDGTPWSPVFTFTVNPDTIYEVSESLIMNLALADGETDAILGVPTASATIYDQDSINPSTDTGAPGGTLPTNALGDKPTVSISATDAVAVEDTTNNTVVFTVTQTNASTQATSIVVTLDRNTVEAADITSVSYIAADGVTVVPVALATLEAGLSLTIPATDGTPWSPVFTFTVNPDTIYEVSESLIMNLALADGETDAILGVPTASATIYDQDSINPSTDTGAPGGTLPTNALGDKPTVSISATDAVAVEDTTNNTVVFTVTQTNASTQATSIVVTLDRNTVEAADITSVSYIAADGVTVVPVALATLEAGLSLTIPATDGTPWSPVFTFTVNPDTIYEVSESLIMNLALADGETDAILGVPTASATIYDQDSINPSTDTGAPGGTLPTNALGDKPTVSISATDAVAVEDTTNNTVVFTVTQTNASTQATSIVVTLDRNTVEAADITSVSYIAADGVTVVPVALATLEAGLSLTIPATDGTPWSPVFTFTVNPDTIYEVSESLIMNLALADGETDAILGVPTASATIYDEDGPLPGDHQGDKPINNIPTGTVTLNSGVELRVDESAGINSLASGASEGAPSVDSYGQSLGQAYISYSSLVTDTTDAGFDGLRAKTYSLSISAGGTSGYLSSDGLTPIRLYDNNGVIEGRLGSSTGEVYFIATVNAGGDVAFTQFKAIQHQNTLSNDESSVGMSPLALQLKTTVIDGTGDQLEKFVDIGSIVRIEDAGPIVSLTPTISSIVNSNINIFTGLISSDFGSDGKGLDVNSLVIDSISGSVLGTGGRPIQNVSLTQRADTNSSDGQVKYDFTFKYYASSSDTTLENGVGTITLNSDSYEITVNKVVDSVIYSTDVGALSATYYNTQGNNSPEISVMNYSADFSAVITGYSGPSGNTYGLLRNGDTGILTNSNIDYVNVSTNTLGVGDDTIQPDDLFNYDFYRSNPVDANKLISSTSPKSSVDNFIVTIDQLGAGEDIAINLKLAKLDAAGAVIGSVTSKLLVANSASDYVKNAVTNFWDVTVSKGAYATEYEAGYRIIGLQIVTSTGDLTGNNAYSLSSPNTRVNLQSTSGNSDYINTEDSDIIKIIKISTTREVTIPNSLELNINGHIADLDGDSAGFAIKATVLPAATPVALDLNDDGVSYFARSANVSYDYNDDGIAESTAWVAPEDGLLALQKEDGTHNIVFSTQAGETDLQGLAKVYDSNKDGVLDGSDADFAKFGVWQDADSDGIVDNGEFLSLADRGITSLSLTSDGQVHFEANGDVIVYGQTTYTTSDGQLHIAEDVGFAVSDVYEPLDIATIIANADAIESVTRIDQLAETDSSSSLFVELGGQTYEIATLAGQEAGTEDILSQFVGGDTSANLLTNKSWTDVIDISSDHGGPGSIIAAGGTLNEGNYANGEGDWTVIINSGDAKVDASNNQITFESESADNSVTIITADGASHDINNVDKIQWHG